MITLSYGTDSVEINYPIWEGYVSSVVLAIEISETTDGFDTWDNGIARDYRTCKIDRALLSETEAGLLETFLDAHRGVSMSMDIGTGSNFFPFGPDKGDSGVFTVRLLSREYGSFDQFKQFDKSFDFVMVSAPSYSLPAVTNQASFQIGTVDGLLYPQTSVTSPRVYGISHRISYDGSPYAVDIRRNIHTTEFTQRCNGGLAAELLAFLAGANGRTQDISIIAPDDYYLFDVANSASGTYTCRLIQKTIECRQLNYEEFEIPLFFWMKAASVQPEETPSFRITIDADQVSGSSNHTNFPFLFSDDMTGIPEDFWSEVVDPDGLDIRFYDADSNEYSRDIVLYDAVNEAVEIWVQIPELSVSEDTVIYCEYGGGTRANDTDIWTDIGGKTILHGTGAESGTTFADVLGRTWTAGGGTTTSVLQKQFPSASILFPGSSAYLYAADHDDFYVGTDSFALSFWVKTGTTASSPTVFYQGDNNGSAATIAWYALVGGTYGAKLTWIPDYSAYPSIHTVVSTSDVADDAWHFIVLTRDGTSFKMYVDGVPEAEITLSWTIINSSSPFFFGKLGELYNQFVGNMDDVRFFRTWCPSADWIATEYSNQNAPATFAVCDVPEE